MSSSGGIGNLSHSHVDPSGPEEVERQEESQSQETVPAVTVGEDHDERALQGLESVYPEAHGNAQGNSRIEWSVPRVPPEIASRIAHSADPATRGMMRSASTMMRNAVNATVEEVTLESPEGANGGSAVRQAADAFRSAKDIVIYGDGFTNKHAKELASFRTAHTVTLINTPNLTGAALTGLPKNVQRLGLLQGLVAPSQEDDFDGPHIKDEDLASLPADLKTFNAFDLDITNAGLKNLPRGLTSLCLSQVRGITDAGMKDLPPNLKKLLIDRGITDAGIKDLPQGIEQLDVSSEDVTGAAIKDIPESVHTLGLPVSYQDMNTGLVNLSKNVHTLTLSGNSEGMDSDVSDEAIAALPKTVRNLHLVGDVSEERLKNLREQNPDRKITAERGSRYVARMSDTLLGGDQGFA